MLFGNSKTSRFAAFAILALTGHGIAASGSLAQTKAERREAFCARQQHAAEREICLDRNLTRLDDDLNRIYRRLSVKLPSARYRRLRKAQLAWLKERNACGRSTACLEAMYIERNDQLERMLQPVGLPDGGRGSDSRCRGEGKVRSINGRLKTRIVFENRSRSEEDSYKIYWLDYKGKRKLYATIYKGEVHRQSTYVTHPWVITSPVPGGGEICVGIYMPDPGKRKVVLR